MIDCDHTAELLPWYLNDTLSDQDRRRVDEHLHGCESCRRELDRTSFAGAAFGQHLPAEVLVDFGFGRSTAGFDHATIEEHLAICERCSEELEMVRESHSGGLESSAAELLPFPAAGKTRAPARSTAGPWRWGTLAATLTALAATSGWLWSFGEARRLGDRLAELEAPQTDVRVLEAYPAEPVLRSEDRPPAPVRIPADTATVTLLLVPDDRENAADHELELIGADGGVRWRRRGVERQPEGDFAVTLRVDTLSLERFTLRLFAVTGGERRAVADYPIEIEQAVPKP